MKNHFYPGKKHFAGLKRRFYAGKNRFSKMKNGVYAGKSLMHSPVIYCRDHQRPFSLPSWGLNPTRGWLGKPESRR